VNTDRKILVYGYGNPGRQDDGLGVCFVSMLSQENPADIRTECNYQLNIEDSELISKFDNVVFVDASFDIDTPFLLKKLDPSPSITFSTHKMNPESVLALCNEIHSCCPFAYLLEIRGYERDLNEKLSVQAEQNLREAFIFFRNWLKKIQ
jgi:hydrogenase maturation protease